MKRTINFLRYTAISIFAVLAIVILATSILSEKKSDEILAETIPQTRAYVEPETVSLSYSEWKEQQTQEEVTNGNIEGNRIDSSNNNDVSVGCNTDNNLYQFTQDEIEPDIYSMDVWTLGSYLYGIPEYDTTRALILITFEGYGAESPLSYYVACCCWVRATEGYWGYGDLYRAFGEADTWNYGEWLDSYGYADYAVEVLRQCYLNPSYVRYCNGMTVPESYVYYEGGIYVW